MPLPLVAMTAAILPAASPHAHAASHVLADDAGEAVVFSLFVMGGFTLAWRSAPIRALRRAQARRILRFIFGVPLAWLLIAFVHDETGVPIPNWVGYSLWLVLIVIIVVWGEHLVPARLRLLFAWKNPDTHGSAHFGTAAIAARHLAPAAPADAFALGLMRDVSRRKDARFRHDGHILTCAPTGAGKGIGAVIPNLLDYPGSAFVLDLKGENYAVTARTRRELGQDIVLIDPFGMTGDPSHALNWLDTLDPESPDVVSRAGGLADMLIAAEGWEADSHWNDTARELLRGLLIYVAGLPEDRRSMAELRRIVTAPEDQLAGTLADVLDEPERERGSVLSTVVRHTAWLDDPRLCAALARSDFSMADLKRRPMTVYLVVPPDRLRSCLGFVRGFIGIALEAVSAIPGRSQHRVAFLLDEFGQLGRMDRLADSITLLRGYGAQLWLFVQDLSQLRAVYPRWQSFLANTSQQFFGTADYDTARYLSGALGQQTIRYETRSSSVSRTGFTRPPTRSKSTGEHLHGRPLLTPDEIMRLGPAQTIVLVAGEPPYMLDRINYLTDKAYAGRFDPNPFHALRPAG